MRATLCVAVAAASTLRGTSNTTVEESVPPNCGDKYDKLPDFFAEYGASISDSVCTQPGYKQQCKVFDEAIQCWFRSMATDHCGDLDSQYEKRNKVLVKTCADPKTDHLDVWKMFSSGEQEYWRNTFKMQAKESKLFDTMNKLVPKQILCTTLHVIDDECVKHGSLRTRPAR
uniref:Uncharacterized protein n=1 Tax=Oxyrrhis marina TaxID=2969 RepID=A0A7S4GLC8_OXYMA|mmetsp:Transcript_34889/g.84268  ORF Transcript_34889/g.84268 Transcript_34889/m.84268 type:complete len:172 (+) Transcript_34889:62-577(+)